jgi:hypothetical protein
MVAGMVDVGEQTGALPDLLMKIADTYDEEVDNAASALTSLLEPILIVCLALIVGSIVVAMYLPILHAPALIDPSNASARRLRKALPSPATTPNSAACSLTRRTPPDNKAPRFLALSFHLHPRRPRP